MVFPFIIQPPNCYYPEGTWMDVASFPSREDALEWAKQTFGADEEGRITILDVDQDYLYDDEEE